MSAPVVIANAVTDALKPFNISIDQLPLSPNRIWSKIHNKKPIQI